MNEATWIAPAKTNLYLEVLGKRSDGFHNIRTLFQAIDLADRLVVCRTTSDTISVTCDTPGIPTDERNLVVKAWRALKAHHPFPGGVELRLEKTIPAGAGLGGGSSDAAAMLVAANSLFGLGLSAERLEALAGGIGSDVPFFIRGGVRLGEGRGERLSDWPCPARGAFVILSPPFAVSTADVYARGGFGLTPGGAPLNILRLEMTREDPEGAAGELFNALEQPAFSLYPDLRRLKGKLLGHGAVGALLCGSGSSLFAHFATVEAAEQALDRHRADGLDVRLALPFACGARQVA